MQRSTAMIVWQGITQPCTHMPKCCSPMIIGLPGYNNMALRLYWCTLTRPVLYLIAVVLSSGRT